MNKQDFLNQNYEGRYPISADTFDFMQNQIEFVSQLASAFGQNVLLKRATNSNDGLIVLGGELYPLQAGVSGSYYKIIETNSDITAQGRQYTAARTTKKVQCQSGTTPYPVSSVVDLTGRESEGETIANHFMPKGAIIMWSGSDENVPQGYHLCDGTTLNQGESNEWTLPDLRGRFIVGKSTETPFHAIGNKGGSKTKTLTTDEMPSHTHNFDLQADKTHSTNSGQQHIVVNFGFKNTYPINNLTTKSNGSGQAFSILPPYYVLAYIIKVI
ncbi:MAG: tail fiber protein [Bacteroidales bacterium]|nr:tail fiber protein [Bacteroidales bacterium]